VSIKQAKARLVSERVNMAKLETVALVMDVEGSVYEIVLNNGQREMLIAFVGELFNGQPIICSNKKLPLTIQMVPSGDLANDITT